MKRDAKNSHNMRISIKRLRYTMEVFSAAYRFPKTRSKEVSATDGERFTKFLAVIVDLQRMLGDIHDSDVVLEVLTDYAYQFRRSSRKRDFDTRVPARYWGGGCCYAHRSDEEDP